jgi:hypothetical protein
MTAVSGPAYGGAVTTEATSEFGSQTGSTNDD